MARPLSLPFTLLALTLCAGSADRLAAQEAGWLGVYLSAAEHPTVDEVLPDSPAEQGGVLPGDEILSLDGVELGSVAALVEAVAGKAPGTTVRMGIRRGAERSVLELTLGSRPDRLPQRRAARRLEPRAATPTPPPAPVAEATPESVPEAAVGRPYLGLVLVQGERALRVEEVIEGSPADAAGFRPGDLILAVGGGTTTDFDSLDQALEALTVGEEVTITLRREGIRSKRGVVPGLAPTEDAAVEEATTEEGAAAEEAVAPVPDTEAERGDEVTFEELQRRARTGGDQLLLVVFEAPWSASSRAQRRSLEEVAAELGPSMWVDAERSAALADRYEVVELPTLLLVDDDADMVWRNQGFLPGPTVLSARETVTALARGEELKDPGAEDTLLLDRMPVAAVPAEPAPAAEEAEIVAEEAVPEQVVEEMAALEQENARLRAELEEMRGLKAELGELKALLNELLKKRGGSRGEK